MDEAVGAVFVEFTVEATLKGCTTCLSTRKMPRYALRRR
jgi:hypothetical protein